ncbi:ATP-binding protein [Streptomyces sp. H27-D2]|uniref:ATP-binding protein n=1 Tax=Streptomyces sp. H27-D2 TaxID=3046304 RepID=UPI002DBE47E1|nr:ATP-binding protein [Streptomyces sp. H27-D2]MEC4017826.1 ATP-binding protein [Streptomyces sp. H27-D2]
MLCAPVNPSRWPVRVHPEIPVTVRVFTQRFSSTRLGARLARHLAPHRLDVWGFPYDSVLSDSAASIVAELAANAATHGRVPGRDLELRLALLPGARYPGTLRIEVSDTRAESRPPGPEGVAPPSDDSETGRGLLLVSALATRWTVLDRHPVGKTVRAEIDFPAPRVA